MNSSAVTVGSLSREQLTRAIHDRLAMDESVVVRVARAENCEWLGDQLAAVGNQLGRCVDAWDVESDGESLSGFFGSVTGTAFGEDATVGDWARSLIARAPYDDAILLSGANCRPPGEQATLVAFLARYVKEVRSAEANAEAGRPIFPRFVCPISVNLTDCSDAGLAVIPAWQFMADCTLSELWASAIGTDGASPEVRLWQASVFPEIASFDASLPVCANWGGVESQDALVEALRGIADSRWAQSPELQSLIDRVPTPGLVRHPHEGQHLPDTLEQLWDLGLVGRTNGQDWELHGAAIAAYRHQKEIEFRMWRGLAKHLLPRIHVCRYRLCERIRTAVGTDRFERAVVSILNERSVGGNQTPESASSPSLSVLAEMAQSMPDIVPPYIMRALHACQKEVRNPLAHGMPTAAQALSSLLTIEAAMDGICST